MGLNLNNTDYVEYMYRAFFGREADEEGLTYRVDKLNAGTADFLISITVSHVRLNLLIFVPNTVFRHKNH
ncbi:MAG: DUF4214 domain-containing protein [Clostridia bacterium]|nr:DUF4214 domain-containing protein [Clostridia bacterium]